MSQLNTPAYDVKALRDAHSSFARLYNDYAWQIHAQWHIFDKNQRAKFFLEHLKDKLAWGPAADDSRI
ncbi:hypothetical protein V8C35DRAFT_307729 [Trichoderma chlorosporum]